MADLEEVVIQQNAKGDKKGRTFRALRVASVTADGLWDLGRGGDEYDRPVLATFAGTENEIRPFVANLLCGRVAVPLSLSHRRRNRKSGYEFMRSAGYKVFFQQYEEGTIATLYLPGLLALDPGMVDPKGIAFVVCPGVAYLAAEAERMPVESIVDYARGLPLIREINKHDRGWRGEVQDGWEEQLSRKRLARMVPLAYLSALCFSNRSRAPIPPDGRFYLHFLLACLKAGIASLSVMRGGEMEFGRHEAFGFSEKFAPGSGYAEGVAFRASHDQVQEVLAVTCADYFERTEGKV